MDRLKFSWNPSKATANLKKHGISFEEARTVFFDDYARLIADPEHSDDEERFILLGFNVRLRLRNRSLPPLQKGGWGGFWGLNAAFIV